MTIRRALVAAPFVLLVWVAVMAAVMRWSDAAPAAVVFFPSARVMANLPDKAAILQLTPMALTLKNRPDLTADLYAAGAWLVLPAGLTGCLPLSKAQRKALASL